MNVRQRQNTTEDLPESGHLTGQKAIIHMKEHSTYITQISVHRSSSPRASTGFAHATFPGFISFAKGKNPSNVAYSRSNAWSSSLLSVPSRLESEDSRGDRGRACVDSSAASSVFDVCSSINSIMSSSRCVRFWTSSRVRSAAMDAVSACGLKGAPDPDPEARDDRCMLDSLLLDGLASA
jgi:hypothetical protein